MTIVGPSDGHLPAEITESDLQMPDYVRMLLFNEDGNAVLLTRIFDSWDLPCFTYPESSNYSIETCCKDLERFLLLPSVQGVKSFTVMAELYGEVESLGPHDDGPIGNSKLMLTECHLKHMPLHENVCWGDSRFLESVLRHPGVRGGSRYCIEDVLCYLTKFPYLLASCVDQRYRHGWYDSAVEWFRAALSNAGIDCTNSVISQEQVLATSTLLKLKTGEQFYYLKAPAVGLKEVSVTAKIASLFPNSSPIVVSTNTDLNCFITAGFRKILSNEPHYKDLLSKLAFFQSESIPVLKQLKGAGCDVRDTARMSSMIEQWRKDGDMKRVLKDLFPRFIEYIPKLIQLVKRLGAYNLPLTLVHGDFSYGNGGFKRRGNRDDLILFDWQYACIAHPFLDLHEVTVNDDFPDTVINEYLTFWSKYEPLERAREAFRIARTVGWCLKIWTSLDCLKKCNAQKESTFGYIILDAFKVIVEQVDYQFI